MDQNRESPDGTGRVDRSADVSDNMQKYDELRQALESECLSSLKASERTQTFAYSINVMTGMIESRFPKWRVVSDVDKLEIHLFYMDKSTVTVFL